MKATIDHSDCRHKYFWEDCCGKIGVAGSLMACIFCLGLPGFISLVSAIGLGFLARHEIGVGMLIACITLTLGGLFLGMIHHHKPWAFLLGLINAIVIVVFTLIWSDPVYAFVGIGGLMASSVLSIWYEQHKAFRKRLSAAAVEKIAHLHDVHAVVPAAGSNKDAECAEG
jgi:hypothetical protein